MQSAFLLLVLIISSANAEVADHPRLGLDSGLVARVTEQLGGSDAETLQALIKRNVAKTRWLHARSIFFAANTGKNLYSSSTTYTPRFNARRCQRLIVENTLSVSLSEIAEANEKLTPNEADRARRLAKQEFRFVIFERPAVWYKPIDPAHYLDWALENAEYTVCVALGYDWLYPSLDEEERRVARGVLRRSLQRYLDSYTRLFEGESTSRRSNWSAVINGAAIFGAAALMGDVDGMDFNDIIAKAKRALPDYYALFGQGGFYPEGPSYIIYPLEYLALADFALRSLGMPNLGLEQYPNVLASERFLSDLTSHISPVLQPNPTGDDAVLFNFGDASARVRPSISSLAWMKKYYAVEHAGSSARTLSRARLSAVATASSGFGMFDGFAILWFSPASSDSTSASPAVIYQDASGQGSVGILRQIASTGPITAFMKAGRAYTTPHSHLDLGSFVLDIGGKRWSHDLGPDEYSLNGYFDLSPKNATLMGRWTYLRTNNLGHSTLTIGGTAQDATKSAPMTMFNDPELGAPTLSVNLGDAYRNQGAQLERRLTVSPSGTVRVNDFIFGPAAKQEVEWRFVYCTSDTLGLRYIPCAGDLIRLGSDGISAVLSETCGADRLDIRADRTALPLDAQMSIRPLVPTEVTNRLPGSLNTGVLEKTNQGCQVLSIRVPPQQVPGYQIKVDMTYTGSSTSP